MAFSINNGDGTHTDYNIKDAHKEGAYLTPIKYFVHYTYTAIAWKYYPAKTQGSSF